MVTRLKTIEYHLNTLNNLADNVLTALTQKTIYIPEGASGINFRSVLITYSIEEGVNQPTGNYTTRRMTVSVNGATATNYANGTTYTGSGENVTIFYSIDAANHFNANWGSATSRTLDISVLLDGSAAASPTPFVNVNVTVEITYSYDDTVTTQIKTVNIPLDAPIGTLGTTKGTALVATIPALSSYLPEANKVIRDMFITVQGNIGTLVNDSTLSMEIDSSGAYTTQISERTAASDRWSRIVYNFGLTGNLLQTGISHEFYLWSNILSHNHQQVWMTVTYEYDSTQSNDMMVCLRLPTHMVSPLGGVGSDDAQKAVSEFWVQESGVALQRLAYYAFFEQAAAISTLNWRIGTGSAYSGYTDASAILCGGNGLMVRNDTGVVFGRGKNKFEVNTYRTDTADFGYNVAGYFLVNYTANKPVLGYGAANRTITWNILPFTGIAKGIETTADTGINIPESGYFMNSVGINYQYLSEGVSAIAGVGVYVQKLSGATATGERGPEWMELYCDLGTTDPETGLRQVWANCSNVFRRWSGDPDTDRIEILSGRRYRTLQNNLATAFSHLSLVFNYHTIVYEKTTNVTNSNGGVITLDLHRTYEGRDEVVQVLQRTGDGSVTWRWYDNTTGMFISAYEDSTHVGRSANFTF
jgi:hypothetical protein